MIVYKRQQAVISVTLQEGSANKYDGVLPWDLWIDARTVNEEACSHWDYMDYAT